MQCPIDLLASNVRAKRERRKDARPGELLAAALELFVEKGFAATRAEEVAKRAGVSKGTLFLYFSSKEELFKAVVRENISGRFDEWSQELDAYEGSSAELLRYCITVWWERVGSTQAAGISKLMMSEAGNFPELAAFYQAEVIAPGNALIQRVLQRGIDSGEFRPMDLNYGAYLVMAPILFLAISKQSLGTCMPPDVVFDPLAYIQTQVDNMLIGLAVRPSTSPLQAS
ncbi:TetR/AcrR family transcriptional regulator [Rhodoferax sp.]|uniref:TetR/AcrR family transcriptional regulator n=1 Tax=Rhodoferax sp. TaxID=50421 RepID=UPI002ACE8CE4|nr:TetR/AcrR family transcriptional regulator [Rhodoferax sp.]MDZ7920001.1 TetR/AcrR family transcriptional regulator [Rhodoferax sp.]